MPNQRDNEPVATDATAAIKKPPAMRGPISGWSLTKAHGKPICDQRSCRAYACSIEQVRNHQAQDQPVLLSFDAMTRLCGGACLRLVGLGVRRSSDQHAAKERRSGEQKKQWTIGECARHDRVQAGWHGSEDGPERIPHKAKRSIQAVNRPATRWGHGLRQPCLLHRTERARPAVAATAKPPDQRRSTKEPGLRGKQCSHTGNGLSHLVGE